MGNYNTVGTVRQRSLVENVVNSFTDTPKYIPSTVVMSRWSCATVDTWRRRKKIVRFKDASRVVISASGLQDGGHSSSIHCRLSEDDFYYYSLHTYGPYPVI